MKAYYYRGKQYLTENDYNRLKAVWKAESERVEIFEVDGGTDTGIHSITELMLTIWNTPRLNEREIALKERIAKKTAKRGLDGLTPSSGYYSESVEHNLLHKLFLDAYDELAKVCGEKPFPMYAVPFQEVQRLYGIYTEKNSIMNKITELEEYIKLIEEPTKTVKYVEYFPATRNYECKIKQYCIKGSALGLDKKSLYDKFPYLCKLHTVTGEGYFQLNVYDTDYSDKAMQNVLAYLGYTE